MKLRQNVDSLNKRMDSFYKYRGNNKYLCNEGGQEMTINTAMLYEKKESTEEGKNAEKPLRESLNSSPKLFLEQKTEKEHRKSEQGYFNSEDRRNPQYEGEGAWDQDCYQIQPTNFGYIPTGIIRTGPQYNSGGGYDRMYSQRPYDSRKGMYHGQPYGPPYGQSPAY
jgi:hypothetical protein